MQNMTVNTILLKVVYTIIFVASFNATAFLIEGSSFRFTARDCIILPLVIAVVFELIEALINRDIRKKEPLIAIAA